MRNLSKMLMQDNGHSFQLVNRGSMLDAFVSNSTQIITDLQSAYNNAPYSTTAQANAQAAAGPMMDTPGLISTCLLKAKEIHDILVYVLEGSQVSTSLTAPSGGVITSSADSSTYNLLVGVYQIIK